MSPLDPNLRPLNVPSRGLEEVSALGGEICRWSAELQMPDQNKSMVTNVPNADWELKGSGLRGMWT